MTCVDGVFCKTVIAVVCSKGCSVFFVSGGEFSVSVPDIGFTTIRAGEFVGARLSVYVGVAGFLCE